MKKYTVLFLVLIIGFQKTKAQFNINKLLAQRHDTYVNSAWKGVDSNVYDYNIQGYLLSNLRNLNDASGNWNNFTKFTYVLNPIGLMTEETRQNWDGSNWINNSRYTYSYDTSDNKILDLYDVWSNSAWSPTGKIDYTGFNPSGKYAQRTQSSMSGGNWLNTQQSTFTYYNNMNNVEYRRNYNWDISSGWVKVDQLFYTYFQDSIGTLTHSLPDANSNWLNDYRLVNIYGATNQILNESKKQLWDTASNAWVNNNHSLFFYTATNKVDHSTSEIATSSTSWSPQFKKQFIYDANDSIQEYFDQWFINGAWDNNTRYVNNYTGVNLTTQNQFSGSGTTWNDSKKITFQYDVNNNNIYKQIDTFSAGNFYNNTRYFYYYNIFPLSVHSTTTLVNSVVLYPNPTSDVLNIELNSNEPFNAKVSITDITGKVRMIITQPIFIGQNKISASLFSLANGNYVVTILDKNGGAFSQKIEVIK